VTSNKLLARKRPSLLPVDDRVVRAAVRPPPRLFSVSLRDALQGDGGAMVDRLCEIRAGEFGRRAVAPSHSRRGGMDELPAMITSRPRQVAYSGYESHIVPHSKHVLVAVRSVLRRKFPRSQAGTLVEPAHRGSVLPN
jgi:Family of unknown function (DUF6308)